MRRVETLIPNEQIVFESKKHWIAPVRDSWRPALLILGAFLLGWISPDNEDGFFGAIGRLLDLTRTALFLVGVAWIIYNIIVWWTAEFTVTNMRVLRDEGLIGRRSSATILESVTDVQSAVGPVGRMLGYGDLTVFTQSGAAGADRFRTITSPVEFRNHIMSGKVAMRTYPAVAGAAGNAPTAATAAAGAAAGGAAPVAAAPSPAPVPPAPPPPDPAETLAQLADLRDRGVITPEDYELKKQEVLARM